MVVEVFTGGAPLSCCSEKFRTGVSIRIGTKWGPDLARHKDRRLLVLLIGYCVGPRMFGGVCTCWSSWSRLNLAKGEDLRQRILSRRASEMVFLRLFEQLRKLQIMLGGHTHGENPTGLEAWKHLLVGAAYEANFHMCALGLRHPENKLPIRKPTRVPISDPELASRLSASCLCPGHKQGHASLEGSYRGKPLTAWAETYPWKFCQKICDAFLKRDSAAVPDVDVFVGSEAEADSERESEPERTDNAPPRKSYTALVQKLHVNTGHASLPQMLRLAQRAKAPERAYSCGLCHGFCTAGDSAQSPQQCFVLLP